MHCRAVIEIMFGRLKDWRRVATRYDRCPTVFLSAIALAAIVVYWVMSPDPRAVPGQAQGD
ncbi:transposase [Sagittula salina]|uniref:transposase n=1 Tax=Sagittula salina TaxID=2820268 RepID=UPI0031589A96